MKAYRKEKIKELASKAWEHKTACVIVAFLFWVLFIDQYSVVEQLNVYKSIRNLKLEQTYYTNKIHDDSVMYSELKTNNNNLEKFAREQYYMKAKNEDVFVIIENE